MPKKASETRADEDLQFVLQQHREFLSGKYVGALLVASIAFFAVTFLASLIPNFSQVGLTLIGAATITGVVVSALATMHRNRNWRLGLDTILERRSSEVIPLDIKSLVEILREKISEEASKPITPQPGLQAPGVASTVPKPEQTGQTAPNSETPATGEDKA